MALLLRLVPARKSSAGFSSVGGGAGTISKSISAYDMTVSDAIYGKCGRYVSRERLQSMLDYEYALNLERLSGSRGDSTAFFAFADTVAARHYQGTNECHGWMGIKYQVYPLDDSSQIIIHVRMLDHEESSPATGIGHRWSQSSIRSVFFLITGRI